jgi:hypothetical protein
MATLRKLAEYPELKDEDFTVRQTYLRESLAYANIHILHALQESEQKTNGPPSKNAECMRRRHAILTTTIWRSLRGKKIDGSKVCLR